MTVVPKIVDSFKASDFDIDFFVSEAVRESTAKVVNDQLDLCESIVRNEIRNEVKACTEIILEAATTSDECLGVLLSIREHLVSARHTLSAVRESEGLQYSKIQITRDKLVKTIEISKTIRRLSKLVGDVEKLRAQFPTDSSIAKQSASEVVNRACEVFGQIETLRGLDELHDLEGLELVGSDVKWVQSIVASFKEKSVQQLKTVLVASTSLAGRDVLAVSKSVQVLYNMKCLREETNHLVEAVVESFAKKYMMFLDKINQELKQSSMNMQSNSDKALNQFWELLDSAMAAVGGLAAQVALLEAVCSLGTDPSTGMGYRQAWGESPPTELTELAWAFFAKRLTQGVAEVAEKLPKLKQAMRSADYLKSGIEKVSEEARHARNEVYDLVEAGTTHRTPSKPDLGDVFRVSVIVERLKQVLR